MGEQLTLEIAPKLLAYVATLVCAGAAVVLALTGRSGAARWAPDSAAARAHRLASIAGVAAVLALVLRAAAHSVLVAGSAAEVTTDTLRVVALESRWGGGWRWQLFAAVATALAAWRADRTGRVPVLALAVAAWCAATPALGHGASTTWQRVIHAAHLGASGAWIGTVLVLAWCLGLTGAARRAGEIHAVVHRFSPWALTASAVVGFTGAILGLTYVGTLDGLWTTPYGRVLSAKLLAVAGLGICGFINWQRSRSGRAPSPAVVRTEAALALVVLALTTVLTETEQE